MQTEYALKQMKRHQKLALISGTLPLPAGTQVCTAEFTDS